MNRFGTRVLMVGLLAVGCAWQLAAQEAPSNVTVVAGRGTVTVSWTGIRNSEVTYRVLRALDSRARGEELTRPLGYSVTSFVDAAAVAGTTYFYQVIAGYPDGSEGASAAVQYPAPAFGGATVAHPVRSFPLTTAQAMPLRASAITATGQYNRVSLSWRAVSTNTGPVSYEVRRAQVDPVTPGAPIGYLTGSPLQQPDGSFAAKDFAADLHLPTWYRLTTKSASQGNVDSPWSRYDPTPHRGVDSIMGGYWREVQGAATNWTGCIRWSVVPWANKYWTRIRATSGGWVDLAISDYQALSRFTSFVTDSKTNPGIFSVLEGGGQILEVQVGPKYSSVVITPKNSGAATYLSDFNHLQPVYVNFVKSAVPLKAPNCQP